MQLCVLHDMGCMYLINIYQQFSLECNENIENMVSWLVYNLQNLKNKTHDALISNILDDPFCLFGLFNQCRMKNKCAIL